MLCAHSLVDWADTGRLGPLVYLNLGSALLLVTSLEMSLWLAPVGIIFLGQLFRRPYADGWREAVLLLFLTPLLYVAALWILMNWLIMEDPLHFLRYLTGPVARGAARASVSVPISDMYFLAAIVSCLAAAVSLLRGRPSGVVFGLLAAQPLAIACSLLAKSLLWSGTTVPLCLLPLSFMAVAYAAGRSGWGDWLFKPIALLIPVALTVVCVAETGGGLPADGEAGSYGELVLERGRLLPGIERHVGDSSRPVKVFVCGYDGFGLLGAEPGEFFVHSLDFNFDKARKDWVGHDLYVLVHRPHGRSGTDSIHWKFDRIFALGRRSTLYDGDWGDWRLFEIIQAPERREGEDAQADARR
jgi:hypothetical protein